MKKWEMPRVKIDQFVANECVSSCSTRPGIEGTSLYVDWNSDGMYTSVERINGHYGDGGYVGHQIGKIDHVLRNVHVYGINPIFTTKPKPGMTAVNKRSDSPYLNTSHDAIGNDGNWVRGNTWVDLGAFDVYYVSSQGCYIYNNADISGGTPSESKAFS